MVEINELAFEYSKTILMKYVKMLEFKSIEIVRQDYIDNYTRIIAEYYEFCEFSENGV
jgi:hypothetical protein